jgi:hypothetical protein
MKSALMWLSGVLFGLGLVCLTLWATNTECTTFYGSDVMIVCSSGLS